MNHKKIYMTKIMISIKIYMFNEYKKGINGSFAINFNKIV